MDWKVTERLTRRLVVVVCKLLCQWVDNEKEKTLKLDFLSSFSSSLFSDFANWVQMNFASSLLFPLKILSLVSSYLLRNWFSSIGCENNQDERDERECEEGRRRQKCKYEWRVDIKILLRWTRGCLFNLNMFSNLYILFRCGICLRRDVWRRKVFMVTVMEIIILLAASSGVEIDYSLDYDLWRWWWWTRCLRDYVDGGDCCGNEFIIILGYESFWQNSSLMWVIKFTVYNKTFTKICEVWKKCQHQFYVVFIYFQKSLKRCVKERGEHWGEREGEPKDWHGERKKCYGDDWINERENKDEC